MEKTIYNGESINVDATLNNLNRSNSLKTNPLEQIRNEKSNQINQGAG